MLQMAICLAVGIFLGTYIVVPVGTAFALIGVALLFLYAYVVSRKGWVPFLALSFFFIDVGWVRAQFGDFFILPTFLVEWGTSVSSSVSSVIHQVGLCETSSSLLSAMLLGQRSLLSPSLVDLYRQTGASHILALSGLHLGILFGLFNFILVRSVQYRIRYLIGFIELCLMWGYALVAGFPSSLCRASLMLSVFIIGQVRLVGNSGVHALGLAAFLLLLISPDSLFDVGFQLSFMAVSGILFIYPALTGLWHPRHRLSTWLYKAVALSFSAQIATLPLLLHYFHSFVLSSLLFSPIYIMLATAILYAALLMLLTYPVGVAFLFSFCVEVLISLQHSLMSLVSDLSFSRAEHLIFSSDQVVLSYAALLCLLPVLYVLRVPDVPLPRLRIALFFRSWPYLLAALLLLFMIFLLST